MSKVTLGKSAGRDVRLDLDVLLRTRMLIQANSGKGKSWLLRRLAEQLFGKVQVIILDPEGEFATLREKFDYVLVGKGGETAAHPRIAALTAQRLLEIRACAVCDLYEMKPSERHSYVRIFLESLIDAPKSLWHPLVIILDEAHVYCPEKGAGESEASEAVISAATRGRKRGYCLIPATQRLGKFRKDAAAEMLNVGIGGTFIDIDRKRAADALGVYGAADTHRFFDEIRLLERGSFYFLGPAISTERIMVQVGSVETTHPEAGSSKHAAEPPPAPDKVKALLPKLVDLPKEAEEKAKTVAELQAQVRSLHMQLRTVKSTTLADPAINTRAMSRAVAEATRPLLRQLEMFKRQAKSAIDMFAKAAAPLSAIANMEVAPASSAETPQTRVIAESPLDTLQTRAIAVAGVNGDLTNPEHRILNACAWLESIGVKEPKQAAVAFLAGYTVGGGAFNNPRGALRTKGLIDYRGDSLILTKEGRSKAETPHEALTQDELHRHVLGQLPRPEQKILSHLLKSYPESIENDELARLSGYEPGGGAFNNPRGRLRTLGLVEYPQKGMVRAAELLFI
jgi:hypothetical protein